MKIASVKMPTANAAGLTLGGGAWLQKDFKASDPATWDGIVIDPDGKLIGIENIGLTVWDNAKKCVQIKFDGMGIIGGSSFWVPADYLSTDESTWRGMVINNTGLNLFQVKNGLFDIDENLDLMPAIDNSLLGTAKTMVSLTADGLILYGGAGVWVPENYDAADPTTWNGVIIDWSGLTAYHGSDDPTVRIDGRSGDFTLGKSTGPQLKYTAETGLFQVPAISTDILLAGSLTSGSGILLDITGLYGFKSSVQTFNIDAATGNFTFGTTAGKKLEFNASTGALTVGGSFVGTVATYLSTSQMAAGSNPATGVVIDNAGIRAYASSVQTFGLSSAGGLIIGPTMTTGSGVMIDPDGITGAANKGITVWKSAVKKVTINEDGITILGGANVPFRIQTPDFNDVTKVGTIMALTFGADSGSTSTKIGALAYPGGGGALAWSSLYLLASTTYVGLSGTGSPFHVHGAISGASTAYITSWIGSATLTGSGNRAVYSDPSGWLVNTASDAALKKNILDCRYGLDSILALRPITYNWKQPTQGDQTEIGFTAQDVEKEIPELVQMNYDGMKSLDYAKLVAPICLAIQQLNAKLEVHINERV